HPRGTSSTTTGVSFEAEGGIRNPACQDEDSLENKPSTQQQQQQSQNSRLAVRKLEEQQHQQQQQSKIHERSQKIMTVCNTKLPWRLSANFVVAVVVTAAMGLGELGLIPNQKIGFYCNDPSIKHKFTGDTISTVALVVITMVVPALVIWATEWSCYSSESYKSLESGLSSRSRQFWKWYGYYTLGSYYLVFIVECLKVIVGEPRPHFIDSCRPKEIANCTNQYLTTYTCTNTELSWFYVNDSDKSFPSGHSALSVFMATYLVWYLQIRLPSRLTLVLVKPWLQCLAVLWGAVCCMSRIIDHRHHWWDVLIGASLGLGFGLFVVRVFCRRFRCDCSKPLLSSCTSPTPGAVYNSNGSAMGIGHHHSNGKQRHQSVKKLLSNGSSVDASDDRELGTWTA
ncbi:hypothetical protein QAD02_016687, partial [Eretmocerus hayati]